MQNIFLRNVKYNICNRIVYNLGNYHGIMNVNLFIEGCEKVIRIRKITGLLLACGIFCAMSTANAADSVRLASAKAEYDGKPVQIELWGNKIAGGYADNLLLLFKNEDGNIEAAYNPTVKGGYNCQLDTVSVIKDQKQLLLAVAQGSWQRPTEYRIIDFSEKSNIREIFAGADNYGVVRESAIEGDQLQVTMNDNSSSFMQIDERVLEQITPSRLTAETEKISSLTAIDTDNDGKQEVFTTQKITADKKVLADVGAVWKLNKDKKWETSGLTILVSGAVGKDNKINDGCENNWYTVLPRKIVAPGGEATYPLIAVHDNAQLQNTINELLRQESAAYLQKFISGKADMAFNVVRADDMLLGIQLISGKNKFVHHHINIDPESGRLLKIGDLLNLQDPDLLPLLNLLNTNKNIVFQDKVPDEWYLADQKLCLVMNTDGNEEVACYAIGNLHKFLKDKKWLS